jgi:replicative DNA helicase
VNTPDLKILSWMMKGSVEFNKVGRVIDFKMLFEAIDDDYLPVLKQIVKYFSKYKTPPSYSLMKEKILSNSDDLHLISLMEDDVCEETEIFFYLDQIKDRYNANLALKLSNSIPSQNEDVDLNEFNSNLIKIASKIERLRRSNVFEEGTVSDSVQSRFDSYVYLEKNPDISAGVLSGYKDLDEFTNGIQKSELMLIVGASSTGKSLLMLNYAINAWLGSNDPLKPYDSNHDDGKNVLYFTLEMSRRQTEHRIDANLAGIRHKALTRGYLTNEEKSEWKKSLEFQKKYPKKLYIVDLPRNSRTLDIEAKYDTILSEFEPDLVVVDYLGIMKPNQDVGQDWLDVGQVAADLHEFCRNKNIAVLSAAQRKAKNKNVKEQGNDIEDVGRSKIIGDSANIIVMIEKRENEKLREDAIIHVVKNRDGELGEVKLLKDFAKSKFLSYPDSWSLEPGDENAL